MKVIDRTGQTHGTFKVLGRHGTKGQSSTWLCLCTSCGSEVVRDNRYFRRDRPIPKGCVNCKGENHWRFKGHKEMAGTYLSRIQKQAEERGYTFDVSFEELWSLYTKQNSKCYLTGLDLSFGKNQTASLDRMDNSKGYTLDNVAWCHKDVNRMKNKFELEYFLNMCKLVKEPKVDEIKK